MSAGVAEHDDGHADQRDENTGEVPGVGSLAVDEGQPAQGGDDVDSAVSGVGAAGGTGGEREQPGEQRQAGRGRQQGPSRARVSAWATVGVSGANPGATGRGPRAVRRKATRLPPSTSLAQTASPAS